MAKLNPDKVPPEFRSAIALAEKWGTIGEEGPRIELAEQTNNEELDAFLRIFASIYRLGKVSRLDS